jgi:cytochrome P450
VSKNLAPGPTGTPIGGNLWKFRRNLFGLLKSSHEKYGDVIRFRIFNEVFHLFIHPDQIKEILILKKDSFSRSAAKSSIVLEAIVGKSVLTLDGPEWADRRKLISPVFGRNGLSNSVAPMVLSVKGFINKAKEDYVYQASAFNSEMAARVAGTCFFGVEDKWDVETLESSMDDILKHHWKRIKSIFDLPHKLPTTSKRKFNAGMNYIQNIIENILNDKSALEKPGLIHKLKLLEKEDSTFGHQHFINESITFFLAGHETTATGLSWCIYLLAKHPEWQEKIRQEAITNLSNENTTIDTIESMKITKAFFQEVIRLYPPVWLMERRVMEDVTIGNYELLKNTSVIFSMLQTHQHKTFWSSPEEFQPQRFLNSEERNPAYMPFGMGGHSCIGQVFATLESVLCLGLLMKQYKLESVNPNFKPEFDVGITLRMKKPFEFKLKKTN